MEKSEKSVSIRPVSLPCHDYVDESGKRHVVSAVLAPIRVQVLDGEYSVAWACSKNLTCRNTECRYSKVFMVKEV